MPAKRESARRDTTALDAGQPGALSPEPWSAVLRLTQRLLEAGEHVVEVPAKLPPGSGC
jgi:hypothetical protein